MTSLLHIEVSPSGNQSVSRGISEEFVKAWKLSHPEGTIIGKDFASNPVPHLDGEAIFGQHSPPEQQSAAMKEKYAYRIDLIKEITNADEILISSPMWNWSIPSVLKAYFDQIIVVGELDAYGKKGITGKKVTFVIAQGGSYKEGAPLAGWDFATGYLQLVAKALGATDVEIILAEFTLAGVAPGMESLVDAKSASIDSAKVAARKRAA